MARSDVGGVVSGPPMKGPPPDKNQAGPRRPPASRGRRSDRDRPRRSPKRRPPAQCLARVHQAAGVQRFRVQFPLEYDPELCSSEALPAAQFISGSRSPLPQLAIRRNLCRPRRPRQDVAHLTSPLPAPGSSRHGSRYASEGADLTYRQVRPEPTNRQEVARSKITDDGEPAGHQRMFGAVEAGTRPSDPQYGH
jgi:hypothetical protein